MMEAREKENLVKPKNYAALINEYLSDKISVFDFEQRYLEMFKQDETLWTGEEFDVLYGLFNDLDAFCYDSAISDSKVLEEHQLRSRTETALKNHEKILT